MNMYKHIKNLKRNIIKKLNCNKNTIYIVSIYSLITFILTYPLIFKLNSTVYGAYDHATTDLFSVIYAHFWWIKEAVIHFKSPFLNPLLSAPFGSVMTYSNFTSFVCLPITILLGHVAAMNIVILFNLTMSAFGMYILVKYLTKNIYAAFISGIVFAFCPNMMVRAYTTYDSIAVQWIPLYIYALLNLLNEHTWKYAMLTGVFLLCNILFAMPYYLVYLPVYTAIIIAVYMIRNKNIYTVIWIKSIVMLSIVIIIFGLYYTMIIGGHAVMEKTTRTKAQLSELALKPLDYFVPHPRSALLKGNYKQTYWDAVDRPEKNSDSNVAYIGYIALILAAIGIFKTNDYRKWIFIIGGIMAFWATISVVSPSGLIHYYAPFARRILIYKVFVQMSIAVLVGYGMVYLLGLFKNKYIIIVVLLLFIMSEYIIVPPVLSVDINTNPEIYNIVRDLPKNSKIIELPLHRINGNDYQGYLYYQTIHGKPLFNPYMQSNIPDEYVSFYQKMNNPVEVIKPENLIILKDLGITHVIYHHVIATRTVIFRGYTAPQFKDGNIDGLKLLYRNLTIPNHNSPYDYCFADLYEITAGKNYEK